MKIKLCGLKRQEDIQYVNELIPDYVGFVFADSKRRVSSDLALSLISKLNKNIKTVGVFVNEDIDSLVSTVKHTGLDVIQLHGDEDNQYIKSIRDELSEIELWKAIRVKDENSLIYADSLQVHKLLLDTFSTEAYGGTGQIADWRLINKYRNKISKPFFLAGGLNVNNIGSIAGTVSPLPFGVDISSGIETDGIKDPVKIKAIIQLMRGMRV